jgi:uncharacterized membrane protein YqjE
MLGLILFLIAVLIVILIVRLIVQAITPDPRITQIAMLVVALIVLLWLFGGGGWAPIYTWRLR